MNPTNQIPTSAGVVPTPLVPHDGPGTRAEVPSNSDATSVDTMVGFILFFLICVLLAVTIHIEHKLYWIAEGEADVNGDPERDAGGMNR